MSDKLLEINNNDWMKGISASANLPLGGLFQVLNGVNPFEDPGIALPSLTPANQTLGTTPRVLTGFQNSGVAYVYAHSHTKLYQVLVNSPYTVVDETSNIYQNLPFGVPATILGAKVWKGQYCYAHRTSSLNFYLQTNTIPVAVGNDKTLVAGSNSADQDHTPMEIGADNNLYYGDNNRIITVTNPTGTTNGTTASGNGTAHFIDDNFVIRKLINDGRYLVIFADNNNVANASRTLGAFRCRVYFWDMVQSDANSYITPDAVWEFNDSYIIGARQLGNALIVIGAGGFYVTNVATKPKPIRPFPTTATSRMGVPANPHQIAGDVGSLYWVDGFHNTFLNVHAYGNPLGGQNIFYNPYIQNLANYTFTCLAVSGNQLIAGCDQPGLFIFNVGSTRGGSQITTIDKTLEAPARYDYTKVVLQQPLSSGQSVQCSVSTQSGTTVSSETKSYVAAKPRQSLLFRRIPTGNNQPARVEDLTVTVSATGAAVARVTSYGTYGDDQNEDL